MFDFPLDSLEKALLFQLLLPIGFCDYRNRQIPNILVIYMLFTGFLFSPGNSNDLSFLFTPQMHIPLPWFLHFSLYLTSFFSILLILSMLCSITGAGGGDAKLISALVTWLSLDAAARLILPGCILALFLLLSCRDCRKNSVEPSIPLGTMIFLGAAPMLLLQ